MSLFICSLNSGSNGNCYYIGNNTEAILVDAGISCKEVERRTKRLGLSLQKVRAIFISHEHWDHIKGIPVLAKKYSIPIYITLPTLQNGMLRVNNNLIRDFKAYNPVSVGDLIITAFPKMHDAADPYSFTVTCKDVTVGVFTDIGTPCEHLIKHFKKCHAAFLETNYDDDMLQNGPYPFFLKKRISGEKGHLSNHQALELFKTHRASFLSHLFLSHLSKNNNCPTLVSKLFTEHADGVKMIVASRWEETPVYHIQSSNISTHQLITKTSASQLVFPFVS
jgi:phosphoribosyl 1,2-cyclic phosphodiesterase